MRKIFAAAAAITVIAAVGMWRFPNGITELPQAIVAAVGAIDGGGAPVARRPIYKHSIIPGGAWDAAELAGAIERDPAVADHYRGLDPATMRVEVVDADRFAFVSYRIGERTYWTRQRIRIAAGETILTNGQTAIRARCGNCISMEPLLPTSEDEPDPAEMDSLLDVMPLLPSLNRAMGIGSDPADRDTTGLVVFPLGGPLEDGDPAPPLVVVVAPDDPPLTFADLNGDDPFDGWSATEDGLPGSVPPFGARPPDLLDPPFVPDPHGPIPIAPTPVPEPGTFILLGSAVAGLLARRWRAARKR